MTPKLRAMLATAGLLVIGGVTLQQFTPQPGSRTMAELRDAGIAQGQSLVRICNERLTPQSKRRINTNQPGLLRPRQSYARIARVAVCFLVDGGSGNCVRPLDGGLLVADLGAEIIIPSLRRDLDGGSLSVGADDGGDGEEIDDARPVSCSHLSCAQYAAEVDAGRLPNPFANGFCGTLNRLAMLPAPCMLPNGWRTQSDGGTVWCEEDRCFTATGAERPCGNDTCGAVDCKCGSAPSPYDDGSPAWRGFNVCLREYASGTQCVPTACEVQQGDLPSEWL